MSPDAQDLERGRGTVIDRLAASPMNIDPVRPIPFPFIPGADGPSPLPVPPMREPVHTTGNAGSSPCLIAYPTRPKTPRDLTLRGANDSPPSPDLRPLTILRHGHSPQRSIVAHLRSATNSGDGSLTMTVRPVPAILGSQQSTLRPRPNHLLLPFKIGAEANGIAVEAWEESDSLTAKPFMRPMWISSLGEPRMVDEVDAEMCVLCGRERSRADVEVKEFQLGVAALLRPPGLWSGSGGVAEEEQKTRAQDVGLGDDDHGGVLVKATHHPERGSNSKYEQNPVKKPATELDEVGVGADIGVGRWMICRDTASCDRAVEAAMSAEDEEYSYS